MRRRPARRRRPPVHGRNGGRFPSRTTAEEQRPGRDASTGSSRVGCEERRSREGKQTEMKGRPNSLSLSLSPSPLLCTPSSFPGPGSSINPPPPSSPLFLICNQS